MHLNEGSQVKYVGDDPMIGVGAVGRILAMAGTTSSHTQWLSGARTGQVDITPHEDLIPDRGHQAAPAPITAAAGFEDSLSTPSLVTFAVRDVYDDFGENGVLNALSEHGTLASLAPLADEAIGVISQRLRTDPAFNLVLASLDQDEADSLLVRVAVHLLQSGQED